MSSGFRSRRGRLEAVFEADEVQVLRGLIGEIVELVRHDAPPKEAESSDPMAELFGGFGPSEPPEDAVLARLLPNAYADDGDSAEFRRYTETGLRDQKVANAEVVLRGLGEPEGDDEAGGQVTVRPSPDEAQAWLKTLTDLRLALGTRLGVEDEGDEARFDALPSEDPARYVHQLYLWLGWLQETLVHALI